MPTTKKSIDNKIQAKKQELERIEERIGKDRERQRQLRAEIQSLESAELHRLMKENNMTFADIAAMFDTGSTNNSKSSSVTA